MTPGSVVAVSGLGCLAAAGRSLPDCLASLFRGERDPRPPSRFQTAHPVRHPVFEVPDRFLDEVAWQERDILRTSRLALAAAREAFESAGLPREALRRRRVGVCLGTTVGSAMNSEEFYREYRSGGRPDMAPIRRFLRSNPAAVVRRAFELSGPCQTVVNACSSGTDAVGIGRAWIRGGLCDAVLTGGADELCRVTCNGFASLLIASDVPCTPFDRDRRGLNLGEGAGMLLLEPEEAVRARGGRVRARVLGFGTACDAHHLTAPHPDGAGLRQAIGAALWTSGAAPGDIAFVNAHGTGTPENDRVESRVLSDLLPGVPFLSTKGYTGHTLGAAGAIEAALTVACLEEGRIPASVGFSVADPALPACPVATETAVRGRLAVSQSLAFGGNNSVLVFGAG